MYQIGDTVRIRAIAGFDFSGCTATVVADTGMGPYAAGRAWQTFKLAIASQPGEWCILPLYAFTLVHIQ